MEEKEEENPAAPERAVLPPTPGGTTAEATEAEQPADYRPTTGPPSVIERSKAGAAPVLPVSAIRLEQPPDHRPGGTTGRLPPNNRSTFCDRAVQGRHYTGCTGNYQKTSTAARQPVQPLAPFDVHLRKPAPDLQAELPPSRTGTSAMHELPAEQPPP